MILLLISLDANTSTTKNCILAKLSIIPFKILPCFADSDLLTSSDNKLSTIELLIWLLISTSIIFSIDPDKLASKLSIASFTPPEVTKLLLPLVGVLSIVSNLLTTSGIWRRVLLYSSSDPSYPCSTAISYASFPFFPGAPTVPGKITHLFLFLSKYFTLITNYIKKLYIQHSLQQLELVLFLKKHKLYMFLHLQLTEYLFVLLTLSLN